MTGFTDAGPEGAYFAIHRAIADGRPLKVRHYGGSQPGSVREVHPPQSWAGASWREASEDVPVSYVPGLPVEPRRQRSPKGSARSLAVAAISIGALAILALLAGGARR